MVENHSVWVLKRRKNIENGEDERNVLHSTLQVENEFARAEDILQWISNAINNKEKNQHVYYRIVILVRMSGYTFTDVKERRVETNKIKGL